MVETSPPAASWPLDEDWKRITQTVQQCAKGALIETKEGVKDYRRTKRNEGSGVALEWRREETRGEEGELRQVILEEEVPQASLSP